MTDLPENEDSGHLYAKTLPRPYPEGGMSGIGNPTLQQPPASDATAPSVNPEKVSRETFGQPDGQRSQPQPQINPLYGTMEHDRVDRDRKPGQKPNVAIISIPLQDHPKPTVYPRPPTPPPILRANNGQPATPWLDTNSNASLPPAEDYVQPVPMSNGGIEHTETDVDTLTSKKNGTAMRKNVSWNETVQFQTEMSANLGNIPDSEGLTQQSVNIQLVRQIEGEERLQEPNGRLPAPPRAAARNYDNRKSEPASSGFKTYMCVAIVLLIFAVGGLLALGSLYAIKYVESDNTSSNIRTLKSNLNLVEADTSFISPFRNAWHSEPDVWDEEGVATYLAENGNNMTWFQPSSVINMLWHKGSDIKVYSLSTSGLLTSVILGDPLDTSQALLSLHLETNTWYAGELLESNSYCVVSIVETSDADISLVPGNTAELLQKHSSSGESVKTVIRKFG